MAKLVTIIFLVCFVGGSQAQPANEKFIYTTDVTNFWSAYDHIISTKSEALKNKYIDSLFVQKGTEGLKALMSVRNLTSKDYLSAIESYPEFWNSIRNNTLEADKFRVELERGIAKLRNIYPSLKPGRIYFAIGALRTNGTTLNNLVLIGSELAMSDKNTVSTEFPIEDRIARKLYFESNPIDNLVLLNLHEYVHTQQKPIVHNLLSQVLYEGVAEFVSVKALDVPSAIPAIAFGKKNHKSIISKFEDEMFYTVNRNKWLWSNAPNDFGVRDLGYYIGYRISELYFEQSEDKEQAIYTLVNLDYSNDSEIKHFVNNTKIFSAPLDTLYQSFEKKRPTVIDIKQFKNHSDKVDPKINQITLEFSVPLNGHNTGLDYGPSGAKFFPQVSSTDRIWGKDLKTWTIKVNLEPGKHYQFLIDENFRDNYGIPLKPLIVEFKTALN